ncbi:MAG: hypothetical protein MJ097_03320, partial [Dorea sp.]|nr:hypothetical protein [Dorea sp.]
YYQQDVNVCCKILESIFEKDPHNTKIDKLGVDRFGPVRTNMVFTMPQDMQNMIKKDLFDKYPIAPKFEVQIRTTFSEGWHEVEHDMVYKHKDEWDQESYSNSLRRLNGLYATLEGCDSLMEMILDERATFCYANGDLNGMLRYKFRIHFSNTILSEPLYKLLTTAKNSSLLRSIFEIDREKVLLCLTSEEMESFNKTFDNLVYTIIALLAFQPLIGKTLKEMKTMKSPLNKTIARMEGSKYILICDAVSRFLDRTSSDVPKETLNFHLRQLLYDEKVISFKEAHVEEFHGFFSEIMHLLHSHYMDVERIDAFGNKHIDGFNPTNGIYYYVYPYGDAIKAKDNLVEGAWEVMKETYFQIMNTWPDANKIKQFVFVINSKTYVRLPAVITNGAQELDATSTIKIEAIGNHRIKNIFFDIERNTHRAMLGLPPVKRRIKKK